eukprot:6195088-Pleurochrysis_carterae.AAC.2
MSTITTEKSLRSYAPPVACSPCLIVSYINIPLILLVRHPRKKLQNIAAYQYCQPLTLKLSIFCALLYIGRNAIQNATLSDRKCFSIHSAMRQIQIL